MTEIFDFAGISSRGPLDADVTVTITLKTKIAPAYLTDFYLKVAGMAGRQVVVDIQPVQSEIPGTRDAEPGEIRAIRGGKK